MKNQKRSDSRNDLDATEHYRPLHRRLTAWIGLALGCTAVLSLVGCDTFTQKPAETKIPRLKVNLPESPPLEVPKTPVRDDSGVYTVAGVFKESAALMNTVVPVKGIVLDRHICVADPPSAAEGPADAGAVGDAVAAEPPPPPECYPPEHLVLVDDLAMTRHQLLVTGNRPFIESLAPGQAVTVKGRLVQWTRDNVFVRSEGLIELDEPTPPAEGL